MDNAGAVHKKSMPSVPPSMKKRKKRNKSERRDTHSNSRCLGQDRIDVVDRRRKSRKREKVIAKGKRDGSKEECPVSVSLHPITRG